MFTEDLTQFFDTETGFAVTATLASGSSVDGIFDNAFVEALGAASRQPEFICRTVDVAAAAVGTTITIQATSYTIREKQPDETEAVTRLILEKTS